MFQNSKYSPTSKDPAVSLCSKNRKKKKILLIQSSYFLSSIKIKGVEGKYRKIRKKTSQEN